MQPEAILETVLYADDIEAAARFYGDVLGLDLYWKSDGHTVMFRCGSQMLLIFNPDVTGAQEGGSGLPIPPHGARGQGHVCFRASRSEMDDWRALLVSRGVEIESEFEWPDGGYSLYFRDPAGNSVEFAEPAIWGLQ